MRSANQTKVFSHLLGGSLTSEMRRFPDLLALSSAVRGLYQHLRCSFIPSGFVRLQWDHAVANTSHI